MPHADSDTDVIVIGAGPVGLTMACELLRHGVRVRIFDKKPEPVQYSQAAVIHQRTQEMLLAMGAIEPFLKEGYLLPKINWYFFNKKIADLIPVGKIDSPFPGPLMIGQQYTEKFLNDHLEHLGGKVERNTEAINFEQTLSENELHDSDSFAASTIQSPIKVSLKKVSHSNQIENASALYLVGCEGSDSITRKHLNIPFEGERYSGVEFLQADGILNWKYPQGIASMFYCDGRMCLCFPYNDKNLFRIIIARPSAESEPSHPPSLEEIQSLVREMSDPNATLTNPRWLNRFRSGHRIASYFRVGRAFIAGDAAHVHIPIGGQGMNYGMQDAFNLAWKLAAVIKGKNFPEILDSYNPERRPVDQSLITGTDRGFHVIVQKHFWGPFAFRFVFPLIIRIKAIQKRILTMLAEFNIDYKDSKIVEDHGGSRGPQAGYRAPDAPLVRLIDQQNIQLFDLFRGIHWTLLIFIGNPKSDFNYANLMNDCLRLTQELTSRYKKEYFTSNIVTRNAELPPGVSLNRSDIMIDQNGAAHAKYGLCKLDYEGCLYLIRPDWYIGYRSSLEDKDKLRHFLSRILRP